MNVQGRHFRTIWSDGDGRSCVNIIDRRQLPHRFVIEEIATVEQVAVAIRDMHVRGAGLIGATAGYGMALAAK
jgi:methylthioribose-1-phosphate isomerase